MQQQLSVYARGAPPPVLAEVGLPAERVPCRCAQAAARSLIVRM